MPTWRCTPPREPILRIAVFDERLRSQTDARINHEQEISLALDRDELELHFQPFENLTDENDGRRAKFEALVRWRHPKRGLLLPSAFIPLAEESRIDHGR